MVPRIKRMETHVPETVVGSQLITNPNQIVRRNYAGTTPDSSAWRWFDRIGEVHFGLSSGARETSRAVITAVRWEDPKENELVDDPTVLALIRSLVSKEGGTPGLIQKYYLNRKVTGDGYLFGYPEDPENPKDANGDPTSPFWFDFLSTDELVSNQTPSGSSGGPKLIQVRREPWSNNKAENLTTYNLDDCILTRVWTPHPRYNNAADSPLKALDLVCEELDLLTMSLKAKLTSRLAMAGILYLSTELNATKVPARPTGAQVFNAQDNLVDYMMRVMSTAIMKPDEASAAIPFILRGPSGEVDNIIHWIEMDREIFDADIRQRDELIARILHGLDLRPEQVEGFGQSNHWSAWSTQDVHLKVDVGPDLEALCWAATKDYLWPQLRLAVQAGDLPASVWTEEEIRRHWVWYDLENLTVRPNKADSYGKLEAVGAVSKAALRDATGAQDNEAPNDLEWARHVGEAMKIPYLALMGTKYVPDTGQIEWDKVVTVTPAVPGEDPNADSTPVGPGNSGADRGRPGNGDSNAPRSERPDG